MRHHRNQAHIPLNPFFMIPCEMLGGFSFGEKLLMNVDSFLINRSILDILSLFYLQNFVLSKKHYHAQITVLHRADSF